MNMWLKRGREVLHPKKVHTELDALQDVRIRHCLEKEKKIQKATVEIRNRFGKNAILKGMNLKEGATTIDRNKQIGGHRA